MADCVKCGCGGEARIGKIYGDAWTVECTECGIQSGCYDTEVQAVTAWNTAMGTNTRRLLEVLVHDATDTNVGNKERKRGKWEIHPLIGSDRPFDWWKCSVCGQVIYSETERDRKEFHAFCGRCGAEME